MSDSPGRLSRADCGLAPQSPLQVGLQWGPGLCLPQVIPGKSRQWNTNHTRPPGLHASQLNMVRIPDTCGHWAWGAQERKKTQSIPPGPFPASGQDASYACKIRWWRPHPVNPGDHPGSLTKHIHPGSFQKNTKPEPPSRIRESLFSTNSPDNSSDPEC